MGSQEFEAVNSFNTVSLFMKKGKGSALHFLKSMMRSFGVIFGLISVLSSANLMIALVLLVDV